MYRFGMVFLAAMAGSLSWQASVELKLWASGSGGDPIEDATSTAIRDTGAVDGE